MITFAFRKAFALFFYKIGQEASSFGLLEYTILWTFKQLSYLKYIYTA